MALSGIEGSRKSQGMTEMFVSKTLWKTWMKNLLKIYFWPELVYSEAELFARCSLFFARCSLLSIRCLIRNSERFFWGE